MRESTLILISIVAIIVVYTFAVAVGTTIGDRIEAETTDYSVCLSIT